MSALQRRAVVFQIVRPVVAPLYSLFGKEDVVEEDDKKLQRIHDDYSSGSLLTAELKLILIEKIVKFLKQHNEKKAKARKDINKIIKD